MSDLPSPAAPGPWRFQTFQTLPGSWEMQAALLSVAASLAELSAHPAARDLARVARANGRSTWAVTAFREFPGEGFGGAVHVPGEPGPRLALAGPPEFLTSAGLAVPETLGLLARRWQNEGWRVLAVGWDGRTTGVLGFAEG